MKFVYCSNCGTRLSISRRALPKYSTIIDVVEYHKCPPTPIEIDLTPTDIPIFKETKGKDKFVQLLNGLSPLCSPELIGTNNLRDRRFERGDPEIKSTAPESVRSIIDKIMPTPPLHKLLDTEDDESESED